MRTSRWIWLC